MGDKSEDDENMVMCHRHLPGLDSTSDETSESSNISIISTIKISEKDRIRFDGMLVQSDESDDCNQDPTTSIKNSMSTREKQFPEENKEAPEVKLLNSVKRNTIDNIPHQPDSTLSVSGLSSFLNITGLTENVPINISLDFQQLMFQDSETQDEHIMTPTSFSEDNDFSPSDGSDFDPAGFNSDDSEKVSEDEYYDDAKITRLKRKRKRRCERLQEERRKDNQRHAKLQCTDMEIVPAKNNDKILNKKNETSIGENRREQHAIDDDGMDKEIIENLPISKNIETNSAKRTWNRRNACFYCQKIVTNFSRHLLRHHTNEIEVLEYKSIKDEDPKIRKKKRQAITDKLRNKGNFIHNSKVSFDRDGESTLLPSKRNNQGTSSPSNYATCKGCLGTFKRATFFRHFRNCKSSDVSILPTLKKKALYNHSITIIPNTASASVELRDNILSHLRSDEISLVVKNDPLIIAYGSRLLKKKKERRSRKAICSKMRDLATLLTILRKKDTSIECLSDAIEPEKYETFIDSIKAMCGFDEQTGMVNITSIPARLRPAILGCIDIMYTQSIMSTESAAYKDAYKKKLDDFKRLIEINWQWEISSNAEKTRKRVNMTKENIIPLDEDIATVMRKIHKLEIKYADKLRKNRDALNYESLCIVTIAHIIMLDRKRAGDVAEAELTFYVNRKQEEVPEKVLETLTLEQRKSIEDLDVFQIPGKRTRAVPVLLTKMMRENIDLIIACREDLNIPSSNRYLFARPGTEEPFDGGKCLEKIKIQCNLKRPEMMTSTGMRHHIATMSQIHAKQNDQYTEHLAGFLGHDVAVHAKNYRLPMQVLQKAVVGTQLIEYEKTYTQKKKDKIETITSYSNILKDKQDENIDKLGISLNESEYPKNLNLKIDRTDETPEITTHNSVIVSENGEPKTKNREEPATNDYEEPETKNSEEPGTNNHEEPEIKNREESATNNHEEPVTKNREEPETRNCQRPKTRRSKAKSKNGNKIIYSSCSSSGGGDENKLDQSRNKINKNRGDPETKKYEEPENEQEYLPNQRPTTRRTKPKPKIRKTNYSRYSSSSDDDEENPVHKRNKVSHRKWSDEEIKTVKKHFEPYIKKKINPGKSKCLEVLNKEPVLQNRTWMQLNTYINNIYKNKKRFF